MTQDRSFAVNRLWPIIYLTALLIVILIFTFMFLGLGAASLMGFATEFPRRIGESVMSLFAAVICGAILLYVCAVAGSLFKTLKVGGPALMVSSEGFRYRFASDDLIPWKEIKDIYIDRGLGIKVAIRFQIDSGFADTLRWRSRIANSFKPEYIAVQFRFIKAPKAEVEEALLRPLQSQSVQASSDLLSKADRLLAGR
ncbi:hypothetical protein [Bradyrhizobium sp. AZCC 2289]|uniref:hypothetical protein n=1 Tax=Bradyrhizobium sp. AZCC 2289 TaxID=3117026 RepID=UPI002FF0AD42